jgi:hypothetical protein
MKARTRTAVTALALLAAVAAAVGIAFLGVEKPRRSEEARKEAEEKVLALDPARVVAIAIDAKGGTVKLARAPGQAWRVVAPVEAPADGFAVQSLLDAAAGLKRLSRAAEPGAPVAPFGLEPPRARLTFSLEGGGEESVALGTDNPFDASVYVRAGQGGVDRVSGAARWSLEKDLLDLRDKRLLPLEEGAVTRLEVNGRKLSYVLARDGGGWRLAAPRVEPADAATVSRILGALRDLRATRFVDAPGPDREHGLDRPLWTVKVADASGERVLAVGSPPKKEPGVLYARVAGARAVAAIPEGALSPLDADVLSLRDKSALVFDPGQAAAVKVEAGSASIEVQKRAGADGGLPAWSLTAPRAAPAASWKVSGLLSGLTGLRATRFADETGAKAAAYGLDRPATVVTVLGAGGETLGKLEVGREEGEKTFVRGSRSPRILEVPTASLSQIPRSAEDLEEKPAPAQSR